jgi:hypothetical protein
MNRLFNFSLAAAGVLAIAGAAQATDLNYNYVQVGYSVVDIDDVNEDIKSVGIDGSYLVTDTVYLFAGYADGESDRFSGFGTSGRLGLESYTLGVGYRYELAPQTDVNFSAAWERQKVEGRNGFSFLGSDSENGYSVAVGMRHLVTRQFEIGADVTYIDVADDDTILTFGALWHITDLVAVGGSYSLGSDADAITGGIRFKF